MKLSLKIVCLIFSLNTISYQSAEAKNCTAKGLPKLLEEGKHDLLPPEIYNCDKTGARNNRGSEICMTHFFCARQSRRLCTDHSFLHGISYIFDNQGKVTPLNNGKVSLKKILTDKTSPFTKTFFERCKNKKLISYERDPLYSLCDHKSLDFKNSDIDQFGLMSAVVYKKSNEERYTKARNKTLPDSPLSIAEGNGNSIVEYRYLKKSQLARYTEIINLEATASAEYCRDESVTTGLLFFKKTKTVSKCGTKLNAPIALQRFTTLPSYSYQDDEGKTTKKDSKLARKDFDKTFKGTTEIGYGAIDKARDYLQCQPKWDKPENYDEYQLQIKKRTRGSR